jgi:HTH-type transcriptional regulator / antitoxin HipB
LPRIATVRVQTPEDLGRAIRARRTELGLDQGSLARRAGVSRQWIVEVEHGKARAEVGLLLRTLSALRLELTLKPAKAVAAEEEVFAPGLVDLDALIRRARGLPG